MKTRILVLLYLRSVVSSPNLSTSQIEIRAPFQGCSHTQECRFHPPGADNRVTCCFNPVTHECRSEHGCQPLPREGSGGCRSRLCLSSLATNHCPSDVNIACYKRPVDEIGSGFHQTGIGPHQGGVGGHQGGVGGHPGGVGGHQGG